MTKHRISASVEIGWETLMEARSYQDVMQLALSKLARGLAEEILKREEILSRKETYQGVTLRAEFYCLTGEQLDQIMQDSTPELPRDEHGKALSYDGQRILDGMFEELSEVSNAEMRSAADWQLEQVIEWLNETIFERGSSLEAVNIPEELKKAMRPTQEDQRVK